MRLPYAPSTPPQSSDSTTSEIYTRIAARRHPRPLIPLDLALLHSPPVADGWNSFLGAIRSRTIVDQGVLEFAISRVAVLNGAVYEWNTHAGLALKAGVGEWEMKLCQEMPIVGRGSMDEGKMGKQREEGDAEGLSRKMGAVLAYTDQMTKEVKVEDEVFERLKEFFSEREIVELTAAVAAYNCVSRFLVALDVGEWNGKEMKSVDELVKGA